MKLDSLLPTFLSMLLAFSVLLLTFLCLLLIDMPSLLLTSPSLLLAKNPFWFDCHLVGSQLLKTKFARYLQAWALVWWAPSPSRLSGYWTLLPGPPALSASPAAQPAGKFLTTAEQLPAAHCLAGISSPVLSSCSPVPEISRCLSSNPVVSVHVYSYPAAQYRKGISSYCKVSRYFQPITRKVPSTSGGQVTFIK
jgi:hypothetical protein